MTVRLHLPDEPVALKPIWYGRVLGGEPLTEILGGEGGFVPWLWLRWRAVEADGLDAKSFEGLVMEYQRERWLWLGGERTWAQCSSGLAGRIARRLPG